MCCFFIALLLLFREKFTSNSFREQHALRAFQGVEAQSISEGESPNNLRFSALLTIICVGDSLGVLSKSLIWLTVPYATAFQISDLVNATAASLRMRERLNKTPQCGVARKQESFIRNALIGHCLPTTLFPHFCKKFSAKYFLQASRKVLLVNFSAKRKSNNEKECFADRQSAMKTLFALTRGRSGQNR